MYDIPAYYIHPTVDGELCWHNASSDSSDSEDMLEHWQNYMHEVSVRKCIFLTQSLCHVTTKIIALSIYEGLLEISKFLREFEEKLLELQ